MNNIIGIYHALRHVETVEDLADTLFAEHGMLRRRDYSAAKGLSSKCELVAQDWVRYQYVKQLRPRATVPDGELGGNIRCTALTFCAIIKSGDLKTLYLVKQDASEFIKTTAFTQKLEPEFFISHFERPLVLYLEPKTLFDDVLCIELFYNEEEKTLECLLSCIDGNSPSREFARSIPVEELSGVFSVDTLAQEELGEGALFLIKQGIVKSISDLDNKFYEALRYALKFLLLKESDKQPLIAERQYKKSIKHNDKAKDIYGKINYQRVSLTTTYKDSVPRNQNVDTLVLDKEGKTLRVIKVRGFLRRQHYGPGNSLVKTVYIDSHESHSWKLDGIRIVKVVK